VRTRPPDPPAPAAQIRADVRYIWCGPSLLVLEPDGSAGANSLAGYYFRQARYLRALRFTVNGTRPHICSIAEISPREFEATCIFPEVDRGGGGGSGSGRLAIQHGLPYRDIDIVAHWRIRPASLRITLELTSRWQDVDIDIAWQLSADFATIDDALFDQPPRFGDVERTPIHDGVRFHLLHPRLGFETHVQCAGGVWDDATGTLQRRMHLRRQHLEPCTLVVRAHDPEDPIDGAGEARREARVDAWYRRLPRLQAPGNPAFVEFTHRAMADLGSLSLLEGPETEWLTPAAGAPIYISLWGRDALTAGWQAGLLDRGDMLADVLACMSRTQGTVVDDARDEQPGRIIGQAKRDPDSRLGNTPFDRYYADVASPFMYIMGLGYAYALSGDKRIIARHWQAAMRVLEWANEYGDRDGDGYIEYLTRSPQGPTHQAWKDSENAVVREDGTAVPPPIASCETQGYWHAALQFMAAMSFAIGERKQARVLWRQAADLRERFNRDFWMEDEGFIAFGLDADKRQIRAITSNAGQCLPTGIVSREHVPRLVQRLFEGDLFSGWGIRTLSTRNPAYNPLDYHLGSVWPVENATILFGLRRYGYNDHALQLASALYDLARLWPGGRVPECVGGYARAERAHPGAYPRSNAPQTWNQSTWAILVQCLIGAVPFAPMRLLLIDPLLPPWLPEFTIRDLRVGDATVSLRFYRERNGRSKFDVLERRGALRIARQPWIESDSVDLFDRISALKDTVFGGRLF